MMEVANEILRQIGGAGRLKAMIGAKNFTGDSQKDNYLGFHFQAPAKNGSNYIKITLNDMDLYDVEFGKIKKFTYEVVSTTEGAYNEDLKRVIELETGLYLSL